MVQATEEPFAQAILDLTSERMVYGRVVLIGDAAFIPRPHTAASTSKAAANALELAEALEGVQNDAELAGALAAWEIPQLRLGQILYRQGSQAGDELLFHTR
jgi:2-polyprenyl-6-methoxyphenol hydroxylase-like FAD-dependent oxidoreductase